MVISVNTPCTVGHMRDLHYITHGLSRAVMSFQWTWTECWACKENWNPGSYLWFRIFLHSFNIHILGVIAIGQRWVSATCEVVMLIGKKKMFPNIKMLHSSILVFDGKGGVRERGLSALFWMNTVHFYQASVRLFAVLQS